LKKNTFVWHLESHQRKEQGALFTKSIHIFIPNLPYLKEKSFHPFEGAMNTFENFKNAETAQYFENGFL
jgi:hypothetical protein